MKIARFVCFISVYAWCVTAMALPEPNFVAPGPGLELPYTDNDSVQNGYGLVSRNWGWTFDTWAGTSQPNVQALSSYRPTLQNDNTNWTAMSETEDWVFRATYNHTGVYSSSEAAIFLKYEWDGSREDKIFILNNNGGGNSWRIRAGDNAGGWYEVVNNFAIPPWADITVHYKAATQTMDAYINGAKIASDFTTGHGRYDVSYVEFRNINNGIGTGQDAFRVIQLAQFGQDVPACGDELHPVLPEDLDWNCDVNVEDFILFLADWMVCTAPECN